MLPGRLIYRKEKAEYEIVPGPLINKVRKESGDEHEDRAGDAITF
jgi:hypothetical protein